MILAFSGTGNSLFVAKKISEITGDSVVSLNQKIKNNDYSSIRSESPLVFAVPTYSWRILRVVEKWIRDTDFSGNNKAYFVMTCGGEIGNAEKYLKKLCTAKNFEYMGVAEIIMPENYIALFDAPEEPEAKDIVAHAIPYITATADLISTTKTLPSKSVTLTDRIKSGIVNDVFYPFVVKSKKFTADEKCVSCGKCVTLCPLNNIELKDGKPIWNNNCTHCMACICHCPASAIEYGTASLGKPRYTCPNM